MGPVSQIDIVPTLLDLMNQPIPGDLQGESLRPVLEGTSRPNLGPNLGRDVFIEWNGPNSGIVGEARKRFAVPEGMRGKITSDQLEASITDPVRTVVTPDRWKLNWSSLGEHELYNLRDDPYETRNLAMFPDYRPLIEELMAKIRDWQRRTGDTVPHVATFP
jgi:arylsulfatase A-like enzyme